MVKAPQRIIDADYEVIGGGYRAGEEHRTRKGWYFTGRFDRDGHPLFRRSRAWFEARAVMWLCVWVGGLTALSFPVALAARWLARLIAG